MEVLNNQTVYKCSFCAHKTFTKRGMKLHEENYCKGANSPRVQNCEHENIGTAWVPMRGEENRMEPDYDFCEDCGFKFD
jgi:DNA-directed RNA polymerase subunit RPC12/RpoP